MRSSAAVGLEHALEQRGGGARAAARSSAESASRLSERNASLRVRAAAKVLAPGRRDGDQRGAAVAGVAGARDEAGLREPRHDPRHRRALDAFAHGELGRSAARGARSSPAAVSEGESPVPDSCRRRRAVRASAIRRWLASSTSAEVLRIANYFSEAPPAGAVQLTGRARSCSGRPRSTAARSAGRRRSTTPSRTNWPCVHASGAPSACPCPMSRRPAAVVPYLLGQHQPVVGGVGDRAQVRVRAATGDQLVLAALARQQRPQAPRVWRRVVEEQVPVVPVRCSP